MSSVLVLNLLWQFATLAMVTLGLAVVFGQLRIMNMAHGEFVMIGAYAPVITAMLDLPAWLQLPICLVLVGMIAWALEAAILRHLYGRLFDSLLATWGISILLREGVELVFGRGFQSVAQPLPGTIHILGADYPAWRVLVMAVIAAGFAILTLWYKRSRTGTEIKAMVANPDLAQAIGINTRRLSSASFVFGCVTAGLAGLMLAPVVQINPMMGLDYLVRSFFALVVGGLGSLEGLGIGVAIISGTQSVLGAAFSQTAGYLVVLVLSILFLWLKPNGLYHSSR